MASINLGTPKFRNRNSQSVTIQFVDTYNNNATYNAGVIKLTGASFDTVTNVLTITATYNRSGFNSQGMYLSLNDDRTSMGNSSSYSSVASGWGYNIGIGEHYAVRQNNTTTVHITNSDKTYIAVLRNGGGASSGNGVTGVTLTVSAVVQPSVLNGGMVPIFFRAIYSSGWKEISSSRWLTESKFKRDVSDTVTFSNPIPTYLIEYDGNGGTTPIAQIKYQGQNLVLPEEQTKSSQTNIDGATVTFNHNYSSSSNTTLTNKKDIHYTFLNWYSEAQKKTFAARDDYPYDNNDKLTANYLAETVWYAISLPTSSRPNSTTSRTVTYNGNTGTPGVSSGTSQATVYYTFNGWYTGASGGTFKGNGGTSYTPQSNHTLYAHWSSTIGSYSSITLPSATKSATTDSCTVSLNANGGTLSTTSLTSTATRTYTIRGWYTAASGGNYKGAPGSSYTPTSASEILYAQYDSTRGLFNMVSLPTPTRTDYVFKGWATTANATVSNISNSYRPTGNITLYAVWEEDQAKMFVQDLNGSWRKGKTFILDDKGVWRKAKKIYVKQKDGTWRTGKNS